MRAAIVPTEFDFHELAYHFLALSTSDRFLRFGRVSSDLEVAAYAESLLGGSETVFVVREPAPSIAGVVHLEITNAGTNLGLSVSKHARRQGIGALLLGQAGLVAISRGIDTLFVRNLKANVALQGLAPRVGMRVAALSQTESASPLLPSGKLDHPYAKYIAGRVTLVDHSVRLQWGGGTGADAVALEFLASSAS
jgi:GNAT superfamily N-acetyltransferase